MYLEGFWSEFWPRLGCSLLFFGTLNAQEYDIKIMFILIIIYAGQCFLLEISNQVLKNSHTSTVIILHYIINKKK
jgi:predicted transcriptional regulator with HTH domain